MIVIGMIILIFYFPIFILPIVDCLMVVDKTGTPQDLSTILTGGGGGGGESAVNGQTTFNKVRIDENRFK
jgi:hypothetical protein